jgi:hypothetical protein
MRTVHALFLPALLVLGSCSEYVTNSGVACLVPKQVVCAWDHHAGEGPNRYHGLPELEIDGWWCTGTYPANVEYEVAAYLYEGGQGYSSKEKCKVDVEGTRLDVTGHFWHGPERDAIVEPGATALCSVGVLSAGTWTLEFGGNSMDVEIGDAEAIQDMICVESDKQHGH